MDLYEKEQYIRSELTLFVAQDSRNTLAAHNSMKMYDEPLVEIAAADDAYFARFREPGIVGPDFILPEEWLPGAKSVISFFLPFTEEIRDSNRNPGLPSEEWVSARIDGEAFNRDVRSFLVKLLEEMGAQSIAPANDPRFKTANRIPNWSERHAAFVAGLGTFGLHRALITAKGTAGRIGSVVTTLELSPTPRPYKEYYQYCPFLMSGKCGACIKRCPPGAISREGKDNQACGVYIDNEILPRFSPRYGCAKCNIHVPCEYKIPEI